MPVPALVPCPQTSTVTPEEGRLLSESDRAPRAARLLERDERQFQTLTWTLTAEQSAAFRDWWRTDLIEGGAWFEAPETWPTPEGLVVKLRRFVGAPSWGYMGVGVWQVACDCEVRGGSPNVEEPPPTDAYFDDVVLLLHADGTNNGIIFLDSGPVGRTPSIIQNVVTSTTEQRFGQSSISSNQATGSEQSVLRYASSMVFARQPPYTIEFWIRLKALPTGGANFLCAFDPSAYFSISTAGVMAYNDAGTLNYGSLTPGVWYFVAMVFENFDIGGMRGYLNGVLIDSVQTTSLEVSARAFSITSIPGRDDLQSVGAYIDDFRYTLAARSIVLPAEAFPYG